MGISLLGIALLLLLDLPWDESSASPAWAASSDPIEVTYGSVLKLMHERTKFRLHSHDVPYGSGSGQQSVTGFPNVDDANSYWIVNPIPDTSAKQGDAIKSGTIIRLQHMRTRKWLHSHLHASPISGNLEDEAKQEMDSDPTFYYASLALLHPDDGSRSVIRNVDAKKHTQSNSEISENNYDGLWWYKNLIPPAISLILAICAGVKRSSFSARLEIEGKGNVWMRDQKIRLQHVDTGGYLNSHDKKYSRIAGGQQEVCGITKKTADNIWLATEESTSRVKEKLIGHMIMQLASSSNCRQFNTEVHVRDVSYLLK